jgi:hypothetical protein
MPTVFFDTLFIKAGAHNVYMSANRLFLEDMLIKTMSVMRNCGKYLQNWLKNISIN